MNSWPERLGFFFGDLRVLMADWTAGRRHSRTRVLLPEPLTPVTRTRRFRGKRTVRFLRLWIEALRRVSQLRVELSFGGRALPGAEVETGRRRPREGYVLCARKHWPVMESGWRMSSSSVPPATTVPPCTPAPGPRSMM